MLAVKSSEVRSQWSSMVDEVVRNKPIIVNRTRDNFVMINDNLLLEMLSYINLEVELSKDSDDTILASCDMLSIYESGEDEQTAKDNLVESIIEYAYEFYEEYNLYSNAPNRKSHLPYVFKILLAKDKAALMEDIRWRRGKN